jgi:hypothetical protein
VGFGFETLLQVWNWLFKSCEVNGRILLREGLIDAEDIEKCIVMGNCKKLVVKLPAWTILQCLLLSAKSDSPGLVICTSFVYQLSFFLLLVQVMQNQQFLHFKILADAMELTMTNLPRDKVFEWFIGPLFVMKEQIKGLRLRENEEICLRRLIMANENERPEEWDNTGFPFSDKVRTAQLQAVIRRLVHILFLCCCLFCFLLVTFCAN